MKKLIFIFVFAGVLLVVSAGAYALDDKEGGDLLPEPAVYDELAASADGTAYVIVMLRKPVVAADPTRQKQREAVQGVQDRVLANLAPGEFKIAYKYKTFAAMTGRVNADGLAKLTADPEVAGLGPDGAGHGHLDVSVPFINADDVHNLGYTGEGITVAVLDSGIDSDHADLSDNIASGWYHFLDQGADTGPGAEDDNGHGTNVSGIITSRGVVASVGVAPDADILAIKVLKANGSGWISDWAAAVDYVVANKDDYDNLCIINMSLGSNTLYSQCPCDNVDTWTQLLGTSLNAAWNAGIVTFASSGNDGSCVSMSSPACLASSVAVAAVYDSSRGREPDSGTYSCGCYDDPTYPDLITCFSNRNACNSLAAPGRLITSSGMGGGTSTYTGTSQAAPHCSGVAALMYEKVAGFGISMPPGQVENILKNTGVATTDLCYTSPNPKRVDALAAVSAVPPESDLVVCEPQGGGNPTHPPTYWYDVTPDSFGRCDFHVRVLDPNPNNYTNVTLPAAWQFAVHQVGNEWWASWWDPQCMNAIFGTFRFQFDNPNPSTWGEWRTTISSSSNPYDECACVLSGVIDTSAAHAGEPNGYGYLVHVPMPKTPVEHLKWSQPPIEIDPNQETVYYCGWDDPSFLLQLAPGASTQVYENYDANGLGYYIAPLQGVQLADDISLSGTERKLDHYDFAVYADVGTAPYTVTSELYTEVIDPCTGYPIPGAPIPGTYCAHAVNADDYVVLDCAPGSGAILPNDLWMVLSFSTDDTAGWVIGEAAELGFTGDVYAENDGTGWQLYWFGGPPDGPYAGFEADIWCEAEQDWGTMVADDYRCLGSMPATSVHWWGSYAGWDVPEPPAEVPIAWRIGFWSTVPADPNGEPNYSYPDVLLWQIEVDGDRVEQDWVGYDQYPMMMPEACFQYYVDLDPEEYFWQGDFEPNTIDDVFWISIAAVYPEDAWLDNPWGWKTRPWSWMDDAVRFQLVYEPDVGMVVDPYSVEPIEDPLYGESFDVAFELDTDPCYIKWEQPFTGIRDWPHYEDIPSNVAVFPEGLDWWQAAADDWPCRSPLPVTAIVWWGSYLGYTYQPCTGEPTSFPASDRPDYFWISIWTDVPAGGDPCYSHPGVKIWEYKAHDYDEVLVGYDKYPHDEMPREPVFRYSVRLPDPNWFHQDEDEAVYWLSIVAAYIERYPEYVEGWGWTNHEHVYNDDAVYGWPVMDDEWEWYELYDQTGESADLSFVLFTEPDCLNSTAPEYNDWLTLGKPKCWCYPRQCRGDIDGVQTGPFHVAIPDLGLFKGCFNKFVLPPGCECADLDHIKTGPFRIAIPDLTIFKTYFNQFVVPQCDQLPIYTGPYNYWTSP
ncbi:MAG: S8 family peptidase [Planctomycetota bacterium]|jgi:subtilisin family serine protease